MRLIVWNVRGCNKPFKQKEIKLFPKSNKVNVAALLETRVKREKSQKILEKIGRVWNSLNNYDYAVNGRIWIMWDPKKVSVRLVEGHEQAVCCELLDVESGLSQYFVAVYACNTGERRKSLWEFLRHLCGTIQGPILCGGDFNVVLQRCDRERGAIVTVAEIEEFRSCVEDTELMEVRALCPQFTWCNNQEGEDRVNTNIDRCLANQNWFEEYSRVVVERLEKSISDHCPQLINFSISSPQRGLFKFYNVLTEHEQFDQVVREFWKCPTTSGNKLRDVWRKCQRLKGPFKRLNTQWFLKTSKRVERTRQ